MNFRMYGHMERSDHPLFIVITLIRSSRRWSGTYRMDKLMLNLEANIFQYSSHMLEVFMLLSEGGVGQ